MLRDPTTLAIAVARYQPLQQPPPSVPTAPQSSWPPNAQHVAPQRSGAAVGNCPIPPRPAFTPPPRLPPTGPAPRPRRPHPPLRAVSPPQPAAPALRAAGRGARRPRSGDATARRRRGAGGPVRLRLRARAAGGGGPAAGRAAGAGAHQQPAARPATGAGGAPRPFQGSGARGERATPFGGDLRNGTCARRDLRWCNRYSVRQQ